MSEFIHSSFRLLLEIYHLECQHFQDQERPLYRQMLQRVVSMPWQIRARYVPLCAIVPYVGSQQVGNVGGRGGSVLAGTAAGVAQPLSAACHLPLPSSALWVGSFPATALFQHVPRESIPGGAVTCGSNNASPGTASREGALPVGAHQKLLGVPEMLSAMGDPSVVCTQSCPLPCTGSEITGSFRLEKTLMRGPSAFLPGAGRLSGPATAPPELPLHQPPVSRSHRGL